MIDLLRTTIWIQQLALVLGGLVVGLLVERLIVQVLHRLAKGTAAIWDDIIIRAIHGMPVLWSTLAGAWGALLLGGLSATWQDRVSQLLMILLVGSAAVVAMRLASSSIEAASSRSDGRLPSATLVTNLARMIIAILAGFIILQNLDIQITPLITALGITGLAVALALQDTLGNLFAGVQIILSRQVRPGDYVKLASGEEGYVTDVKGRNSTIRTFPDQNLVVVPNGILATTIVTNFSLPEKRLWVTLEVGVSYDSNLERVEEVSVEVAKQVLEQVAGGISAKEPFLRYTAFADSSINFRIRLPVQEFTDQFLVTHEFIKRLHERYAEEGIEIPFPIRTVHLQQKSAG